MQLADAYLDSLPKGKDPADRSNARIDYLVWFFEGFVRPQGSNSPFSDDATQVAFHAGQTHWRDHPSMRSEMMAGFGYVETEVTGKWIVGFEASFLVPDSVAGERWWLGSLGNVQSDISPDSRSSDGGVTVRVSGYLSPPGRYGHMNGYARQLLAAKIARERD